MLNRRTAEDLAVSFVPADTVSADNRDRNTMNGLLTGEHIPGCEENFHMGSFRKIFDQFKKHYESLTKQTEISHSLAAFYTQNFCRVICKGKFEDVTEKASVFACWNEWTAMVSGSGFVLPPEAITAIRQAANVLMNDVPTLTAETPALKAHPALH